jgi:phosphatidylinositol alpha-1,6-mannosyltransferase
MRTRPRVLLLTPDFPPATGGIQELLGRLVEEMQDYEITVVTRCSDGARDWLPGRPYRVVRMGQAGSKLGLLGPLVAGMREGLLAGTDLVVAAHVVCLPAALLLHRLRGFPFVVYLYANELPNHRRMLIAGLREAAVTIAISRHTRDLAAELGASVDHTLIIPPGVILPPAPQPASARDPGLVVTVARLREAYKGHDVMLQALPRLRELVPGLRWLVIGEGPLRAQLESRARELEVADAVTFAGRLHDRARDEWLNRAQVFAMPSRLPPSGLGGEGFGIVYLEAAAHGLPVVAGRVGGALDAVRDGETGLLVDPTSPAAVAEAVARIMTDSKLADAMATAARRLAAAHNYPVIARHVGCAFERALA